MKRTLFLMATIGASYSAMAAKDIRCHFASAFAFLHIRAGLGRLFRRHAPDVADGDLRHRVGPTHSGRGQACNPHSYRARVRSGHLEPDCRLEQRAPLRW